MGSALARLAVGVVAATVMACGGGGDDGPGRVLEAHDYEFRPDAVAVTAGQQVTLRITNKGTARHNVSIPAIDADVDYEPGKSSNLIFVAPAEAGSLEFFCKYHRDRLMTGAFFVRE